MRCSVPRSERQESAYLRWTRCALPPPRRPGSRLLLSNEIEAGRSRLVLDLGKVSFIDSTGLGALVGLLKRVGMRGELVVCGVQPSVEQMFRLTRMDRVFRIFRTADEAVAQLERA